MRGLMPQALPKEFDPRALVRLGAVIRGRVSSTEMQRLTPLLRAPAEFDLIIRAAADSRFPVLQVRIDGRVSFVCQRCLAPMSESVELDVRLGLVTDEGQIDGLPDGVEPLVLGRPDAAVKTLELVEDEILIGLPDRPMHPFGNCQPYIPASTESKVANPFSVLDRFKKSDAHRRHGS